MPREIKPRNAHLKGNFVTQLDTDFSVSITFSRGIEKKGTPMT